MAASKRVICILKQPWVFYRLFFRTVCNSVTLKVCFYIWEVNQGFITTWYFWPYKFHFLSFLPLFKTSEIHKAHKIIFTKTLEKKKIFNFSGTSLQSIQSILSTPSCSYQPCETWFGKFRSTLREIIYIFFSG